MSKAYGRLDIFWPDGRLETFVLREEIVQVGRGAHNDLQVDTDGVDETHIRLAQRPEGVVVVPVGQALETFVDGVAVPNGEPIPLRGGEEIQLGPLRIVFRQVDDTATVPILTPVEDTQRIEVESTPFRIELQLPQISVVPGSYISVELSVTNTGRESERYTIEVHGVPSSWVRVNRPVIVVDEGDTGLVMINLRPTRHSESRPGEYAVTVVVTPDRSPQDALRAMLAVRVQPFSGFGIALGNSRVSGSGGFRLHLHNHGSAPLVLRLTARDNQNRLNLRLTQTFAQLGPGERMVVIGSASPRDRRVFGTLSELPFEIIAHADALPQFTVAVPGRVVDRPPLPGWTRLAVIAGALLALALIAFGVWGLTANRRVTPVISQFSAGASQVVRGQPLALSWNVSDAESLTLSTNGSSLVSLPPQGGEGTYVVDTTGLPPDVTFTLAAVNRQERAEAQTSVKVYTPVNVSSLTISPPLMFRNVIQTVTISWDATGFTGTPRIRGLDALGQPPQIDLAPGQTQLEFVAMPQQNFTVRLVLTDERGTEFERTEDVRLTDPQCTAVSPNVPLFVAPDESAAVLSRLAQGVARVVTGRDGSGGFLRVRTDTGTEGWGRMNDFACPTDLFNVADLRVVMAPPVTLEATLTREPPPLTPVPTATRTLTPTASPSATPQPLPSNTIAPAITPTAGG